MPVFFLGFRGENKKVALDEINLNSITSAFRAKFEISESATEPPGFFMEDKQYGITIKLDNFDEVVDGSLVEVRIQEKQGQTQEQDLQRQLAAMKRQLEDLEHQQSNKLQRTSSSVKPELSETKQETNNQGVVESCEIAIPPLETIPGNIGERDKESHEKDLVVKVRGLPWGTTNVELVAFFQGAAIASDGIVISKRFRKSTGKFEVSGVAYVKFEGAEDLAVGLSKHKQHMSHRYIEVFQSSLNDFEREKDRAKQWQASSTNSSLRFGSSAFLVRMRGLPFNATRREIKDFFGEFDPLEIHVILNQEGRATGEAFVEFSSGEAARNVVAVRNKAHLGQRYIELSVATFQEYSRKVILHTPNLAPRAPWYGGRVSSNDHDQGRWEGYGNGFHEGIFVRVRGIPFDSTEADVAEFFRHTRFAKIYMQKDPMTRRPSGQCFVKFFFAEDADNAIYNLHRKHMGKRYVELFRASDMDKRKLLESLGDASRDQYHYGGRRNNQEGPGCTHDPCGEERHAERWNNHSSSEKLVHQRVMSDLSVPRYALSPPQAPPYYHHDQGPPNNYMFAPERSPLSCVAIQNLSVYSTEVDITEFFHQGHVFPIRIHRKEDGTNAFVEFSSEKEAHAATYLNNMHLGSQAVSLSLVSYQEVADTVGIPAPNLM
mmetsp:Transcript_37001/g.72646  ORF Transcript_37001/g.72646 Transcript_37001/m.72646 type:complete len:659 (+) Transcript_37001:93-2069(+)